MDSTLHAARPLSMPTSAQASWARLVLRFNLQPAAYADASWLPDGAAQASGTLLQDLSLALLREHRLEADHDWWLNHRAARLFLIDPPQRTQLALAVGVAAHRDSLRQVVRQAQLADLRATLGDVLDTLWLPVAEAIERAAAPLPLQWDPLDAAALASRLIDDGYAQLLRLLDPHNPLQRAAAVRAAFCAPKALSCAPLPCLPRQRAEHSADAIVNDLLPRWAPAWTWLF